MILIKNNAFGKEKYNIINLNIYKCKDAIQCRPWATPPAPIEFEFRKLKTPFWAKKKKRNEIRRGNTFYARLF